MGVFGAVVQVATLSMLHARQDLLLGGAIAGELIGDEHARDVGAAFQQLPEELLRGRLVLAALHENIEDVAGLIARQR